MIPRLPRAGDLPLLVREFLAAVAAAGLSGDISSTEADREVFSTDNSIYRLIPQAIIFPRGPDDVVIIMKILSAARYKTLHIAPRGGGTGTNAQSLTDGIVVDLSRHMNRILEINAAEGFVQVEAGVVKDQLNAALAASGMFFAPELSTSNRATIGGMVSTDASGQGSCLYGKTRDHVLALTTVFTGGEIFASAPIDDDALAIVQQRVDIIGSMHRVIDAMQQKHAAAIEAGFPKLNRCLTGYDLAHIRDQDQKFDLNALLCGAEGTLGILTSAKLRILPIPRHSAIVNLRYETFDAALRDARVLQNFGAASIETIDSQVLRLARGDVVWDSVAEFFPETARPALGINMVEFTGHDAAGVAAARHRLAEFLDAQPDESGRLGYTVASGEAAVQQIWTMRKRAVGLLGNMSGEKRPIPFVEDTAVPPEHLADYIGEFSKLLDSHGLEYGMFGHVDAGVLHVRPAIDMKDPAQAGLIREISDEVVQLTKKYHGLLWGEHGKGVRSEYAPEFFGPLYPLLQAVKAVFDPANQLNPGKIAAPTADGLLRIDEVPTRGTANRILPAALREDYAAAMHCNGNGACFNYDLDDAMCPSWKGTRERRHSPKGRAMLVQEWLRRLTLAGADPVVQARTASTWRGLAARAFNTLQARRGEADFSHEVKAAMDGCLACKSCAGGCPIKVDVPNFRAKFLELYHGRYLRPPRDHLVAALERLLPLMARAPVLSNAVTGSVAGRTAMRWLGLVDTPLLSAVRLRSAPNIAFATPERLQQLSAQARAESVVLVQDAFTTHYEAALVLDTIELLQRLKFRVWLAPYMPNGKAQHVHGFLGDFAKTAGQNAQMLQRLAQTGVTLVGLDPSVTLTYRGEYTEALGEETAPAVLLLQEFLARHRPSTPTAAGPCYRLLPHCTERSLAGSSMRDWQAVFAGFGLNLDVLPAGCCGMAGTYGHEAAHKTMSERIYGLSWKPKVDAGADRLLATGFSCRAQAARFSGVSLRHPVQVLLAALPSPPL